MTDLPPPVARLIDAANANDTAAFVAALTPDGAVDDWGREFRGPEAVRGWSDAEFIGVRVSLDVTDVEVRDNASPSPHRSAATASTARATSRSTSPETACRG